MGLLQKFSKVELMDNLHAFLMDHKYVLGLKISVWMRVKSDYACKRIRILINKSICEHMHKVWVGQLAVRFHTPLQGVISHSI